MILKLKNIITGNTFCGVEVFSANERLAFVQLKQKKGEIIVEKQTFYETYDALLSAKPKTPVSLIINNEHVLHREVPSADVNDKKLLHKAFPNINLEDFYFEIWRRDTSSIVAICRKAYVDDTLAALKDVPISSVSLGVLALSAIMRFPIPEILTTNMQTIDMVSEENIISTFTGGLNQYDINGQLVENIFLMSFTGALQYWIPKSTTGNINELNTWLFDNYIQKALFTKGFRLALGILLGLLLINFILFTHYYDNATAAAQEISVNKAGIENIEVLKKNVLLKEERLKSLEISVASASSAIINNITASVPPGVLLQELLYNPLEKKVKAEENIIAQKNVILLSGSTINNTEFTGWVTHLQKKQSLADVTITSFGKDQEGVTVFSLKITLQDETEQKK
jgi:Tfp pilus assembly protein PilN